MKNIEKYIKYLMNVNDTDSYVREKKMMKRNSNMMIAIWH